MPEGKNCNLFDFIFMILSDLSILALEIDYQLSMFACISEKSKTKIACIINYCCSGVFPTKFLILTGAKIISYCNTKHSFPPFSFM